MELGEAMERSWARQWNGVGRGNGTELGETMERSWA